MMTPLPLGITFALTLACGALPLMAQSIYVPSPLPLAPGARPAPDDMYLEALNLINQSAELVKKRDYVGAIRLTQQADVHLEKVVKEYPEWKPNLLQQRRQIDRDNVEQWQKLAQQQAASQPDPRSLPVEQPNTRTQPKPKPNIALPPGYKGVDFPTRPGEPLINRIPSPSIDSGNSDIIVESNYDKVLKELQKTKIENRVLIEALKRTRKMREEALTQLAMADTGQSIYRDELIKLKKQMTEEGRINNTMLQTLTKKVQELELSVANLEREKTQHLAQIATLQQQLKEHQDKLAQVTDEKNALQQERDRLLVLVELNSPDKTKNLLDRNLTLTAQLKDALDKIGQLETAKSDSEEQRVANLRALEAARGESAELKQKLMALQDEHIGYRKRITELNTKLVNAEVELANMDANPSKQNPLLVEEIKLLRTILAKHRRVLSVQAQGRSLLINSYKRIKQDNPDIGNIVSLMDDENTIKLTPAEQALVKTIDGDKEQDLPLTAQQEAKIEKLAQALFVEKSKADQLKKELEQALSHTDKKGASKTALAKAQEAVKEKDLQVTALTKELDTLKSQFREQTRLTAIANQTITPAQENTLNRSIETTIRKKLTSDALARGASEAFSKKRYAAAEQLYRTLLELQPQHVPALVNLGTILLQLNKAEEAITHFKKATELDASSAPAWFMMGVSQYRIGLDQQAIASLSETVKLDPANADALLYLGNLETTAGNYEKAVGYFETALKIRPDSTETHFNLAWTYSRLGRTAPARKSYDSAILKGGLPDPELELAITGSSNLPRKDTKPTGEPQKDTALAGPQLVTVATNPASIPSDGNEVPASVAEDPKAQEKPTSTISNMVVNHRPEPASLPSQTQSHAQAGPDKSPKNTSSVTEQSSTPKAEEPPRRHRFRIGS